MTGCLQAGDWRAYLDGELRPEEMVRAGEHLAECAACRELHQEIAGRASRVSSLMMDLDAAPVPMVRNAARRPVRAWVMAGMGVAAALAAAFVLAPQRVQTVEAPTIAQHVPEPVAAPPAPPVEVAASEPRVSRRKSAPQKRAPKPQYYLALDDQPIETGTVMRVAFESGMQADVIVDADGRPRAIRAVR
jgi:anti-sigma factor RsiW